MIIKPQDNMNEKESLEINMTKDLVSGYYGIVKKKLGDIVPKIIMNFLVNKCIEQSQNYLVVELYKGEEAIESLLEENTDVAKERIRLSKLVEALKESIEVLSKLKEEEVYDEE